MTDSDTRETATDNPFWIKRRTFVGASLAVGGAVATASLLSGCSDDEDHHDETQSSVVRLRINGEDREISVDNRTSLLDMLRERAELPGTKKGYDQSRHAASTTKTC